MPRSHHPGVERKQLIPNKIAMTETLMCHKQPYSPACPNAHDHQLAPHIWIRRPQSHPTKTVRQQPTTWSVTCMPRVILVLDKYRSASLLGSTLWALPPPNTRPKSHVRQLYRGEVRDSLRLLFFSFSFDELKLLAQMWIWMERHVGHQSWPTHAWIPRHHQLLLPYVVFSFYNLCACWALQ
jgi:hypothetical protein